MSDPIPYDPACSDCRRYAGKDSAGVTRLCETHKADEIARLKLEVAEAHSDVAHLNLDRLTVMARALAAERERDEAVSALRTSRALSAIAQRERDEARAEIERLRAEKATDAWHTGWQEAVRRMQQAERQLAEAVALLREIAEDGQCPLCDLSDGAHDVGCRLDAAVQRGGAA